jgi:aminoglycoside phosphotransferase (APT) family kinase protein
MLSDGFGQVIFTGLTGHPKIIRLDEHRVLKSAVTDCRETDAMEFIAANTTIPVPRVYETRFSSNGRKASEIVMEYIPGEPLDKAWANLTHEQRVSTCRELNGYLTQLQKIPGQRIEGMNGTPVTVGLRLPRQGGPFATEKEFHDFVVEHDHEGTPAIFKRYVRAGLRDDHKICFAHGDFSPRNIMVDETGRVKAVLDWDRSGFYPEYWDQNRMLSENTGLLGWSRYLEYIFPFKYIQEVLALGYLLRVTRDG